MPKRLRFIAFGRIEVLMTGEGALPVPQSAEGLIALLALNSRTGLNRQRAAEMLWPDSDRKSAQHNLATTLWRLKKHAPQLQDIVAAADRTRLDLGTDIRFLTDLEQFERKTQRFLAARDAASEQDIARAEAAVELYKGDAFPGLDFEWAVLERERLRNLFCELLFALAQGFAERGDYGRTVRYGERLVMADPYREDVHRLLMRAHVENGNRASAIRQYRICQGELAETLGVEPMPETVALYEHLVARSDRQLAPSEAERRQTFIGLARSDLETIVRRHAALHDRLVRVRQLVQRAESTG
ncbi:AfsR/SARP family transcriptional regulator [Aurantiacibacter sediminis]|uniref:Bacterial transcriptional activator domain-containing protein n=1 Tax=Aurantiacibacter sediminis TaxID=2793064 RepID=A0ABS0N3B0_9SPHN|nr:BTAD domain-containing putative transcriptional regulator [Aurantiacibacter sediminis]MBH5322449.1 hypothetical protein [Aurantiacibacter sediminis]